MSTFSAHPNTVTAQLLHWSNTDPDAAAFIFRSDDPNNSRLTLTRRDVFTFASHYAAILKRRGIQHGDIVCNTLPNSPERLLTDMGIMVAGAATMNGVVCLADGSDLMGSLRRAGCKAIITAPAQACNAISVLQEKFVSSDDQDVVDCPDVPTLKYVLKMNCQADEHGLKPFLEELKQEVDQYVAEVLPSDMAFIMTTSGSTGYSKLVPRTHAMLLDIGRNLVDVISHEDGRVFFNDRPLGWITGLPVIYLAAGSTRVLLHMSTPSADPLALAWRSVWEEGVTVVFCVPVTIDMSLARPELWQNKGKLHRIITGGQPVRKQHLQILQTGIVDSVCIMYGSTEVGYCNGMLVTARDMDRFQDGDAGPPSKGFQVKILDDNQEEIKETGKTGEIIVRGGQYFFSGYLGQDMGDKQDIFTQDGFFRTSDMGFWNSQGHLHVICRKSNAIMHGAFIVYPGWLESRIEKCPGVQDVIVVPVPDPTLYHELCACVLTAKGVKVMEEEVRQFCKSLFLISDKSEMSAVPRFYVFFDSFPVTSTGKTDRRAIRDLALKRLGMHDSSIAPTNIL